MLNNADIICPHLDNGTCRIASVIAAGQAATTPEACTVCLGSETPKAPNAVTVSLATAAAGDSRGPLMELWRHLIKRERGPVDPSRLRAVLDGTGPGSQLWNLLESIGVIHDPSCDCLPFAERMNAWGVAGSRAHRSEIIRWLQTQQKRYGWSGTMAAIARATISPLVFRLSVTDPYGSLVDEAIRRAAAAAPSKTIDIVVPLGPGSRHQDLELRFALRSIARHVCGLRRIVVIGAIPCWLRETEFVQPVPLREFDTNKASRIALKVEWAWKNLDLTSTIAFWNDDYVMTRDFDVRGIPPIYRGDLWRNPTNGWKRLLRHTAETLHAGGLPCHHYDIHVPILYSRDKWFAIADWWERGRKDPLGLVAKSVYGNNHYQATCVPGLDAKLQANWSHRIEEVASRRWILSYGDAALCAGLGNWLRARYPDPCPWETVPLRVPPTARRRKVDRQRERHNKRSGRCCG